MRWAEVSGGVVSQVTISDDETFGADWLNEHVGGSWVLVAEDVVAGPGFLYDANENVFVAPPEPEEITDGA